MNNQVNYALPFGPLGRILHHSVVQDKLNAIFSYRHIELQRRFGNMKPVECQGDLERPESFHSQLPKGHRAALKK